MSTEDEAATIIADLFASLQSDARHTGRAFLYGWERRAVKWLRDYRERGGSEPLNAWTMSYVRHDGPPPWPRDETI